LLLSGIQVIPFIGESGQTEQGVALIHTIDSGRRAHGAVEFGGLVQLALERVHVAQPQQRRTRAIAVPGGFKLNAGIQKMLPGYMDVARQQLLDSEQPQAAPTPTMLAFWKPGERLAGDARR